MIVQARYTEVLCNLLENEEVKPLIDKALSTYPMYVAKNDNNYSIVPTREELNRKLLNFYKYREIGTETVGRFIEELEIAMNEIMPYYYQLFKSADVLNGIDDPFGNVDITESFEQTSTGESTSSSESNATSSSTSSGSSETNANQTTNDKAIKSLTPDGQLNIGTKDINSVSYGDEAGWTQNLSESSTNGSDSSEGSSESSSEGTSSSESKGTLKHTFTKVGNQGVNTYAHDLKELRETFLNIEQMIINDRRISELFMNVY